MRNQNAESIYNIGHVENMYTDSHARLSSADARLEWQRLNSEAFCLFVSKGETYSGDSFSIAKSCALQYTAKNHREYYNVIFPNIIEEIEQMPCLFAERNADFRRAASNQFVTIGRITGIIRQGVSLRFGIKKYGYFKQQLVNDNVSHFGLLHNDLRTQLDVEHWSIRSGSLQQIISELNIGIEWLN